MSKVEFTGTIKLKNALLLRKIQLYWLRREKERRKKAKCKMLMIMPGILF